MCLRRLLVFAAPHRVALTVTVLLLSINVGLRLVGPEIIQRVIDGPLTEASQAGSAAAADELFSDEVLTYSGWFLLVASVLAANMVLLEWLMNRTGQRIVLSVRDTLFHHTLRLPLLQKPMGLMSD